jgi:hypothetical protein
VKHRLNVHAQYLLQVNLKATFIINSLYPSVVGCYVNSKDTDIIKYLKYQLSNPNIKYKQHDSEKGQINEYQRRDML